MEPTRTIPPSTSANTQTQPAVQPHEIAWPQLNRIPLRHNDGASPIGLLSGSAVKDTLVLYNNTLVPGNFPAFNGIAPQDGAYDPALGEIFVSESLSNNVSVINDTTDSIVATIPVGDYPLGVVYDAAKGEVFVDNQDSDDVNIISAPTNQVVATVGVGSAPWGIAYDNGTGEIFVVNTGSNNVSVINDSTNLVVATIAVGASPWGMAHDSGLGEVFVANYGSSNVSVISDTSLTVIASVAVASAPSELAYDSNVGAIFVTHWLTNNVSIISDATNAETGDIAVGDYPEGVTYDAGQHEVIVVNTGSNDVSIIADSNDTIIATVPVGTSALGATYDVAKGLILVGGIDNLTMISDSTNTVVGSIAVGACPDSVAYDSGKGEWFVSSSCNDVVDVVSNETEQINATVQLGGDPGSFDTPWALAYDSAKGEVFVADGYSDDVKVISDSNNSVVATVPVGVEPWALAYDSGKGEIFVGNVQSNNISVISASRNAVVATISLGSQSYPYGIAYDPTLGELFVTESGSSEVAVISDATNSIVATVRVGFEPWGVAFDPATGEAYVADYGSYAVSAISASNNSVVATIPIVGYPIGMTYDPALSEILAATNSNNLTVISATTNTVGATIPVGSGPEYLAYDQSDRLVCVTNGGQGTLSFLAPPALYDVAFNETGLAARTPWSVILNLTTESTSGSTIQVALLNGTYNFTVVVPGGYTVRPTSGTLSVNGAAVNLTLVFTPIPLYTVSFTETGLASGTSWNVNLSEELGYSTGATITFSQYNGTYWYTIDSNLTNGYAATPSSGNVTVSGAAVAVSISFVRQTYVVSFTETGLPSGTDWSVQLNGSTEHSLTSSVQFQESGGTYPFTVGGVPGYTVNPSSGSVTVYQAATGEDVAFSANVTPPPSPYHSIVFDETGLPTGTGWGVVIGSSIETSLTNTVTFLDVLNGSYGYVLLSISGYSTTYSGIVNVSGGNVTVDVTFVPVTYPVFILEFGLANGTNWSVTVSDSATGFNETHYSTSNSILFELPNGTYSISVSLPPGYAYTLSSPTITIAGRSGQSPSLSVRPTRSASPSLSSTELAGLVGAAVIIALVVMVAFRRRRSRPPPRPPGEGPPN